MERTIFIAGKMSPTTYNRLRHLCYEKKVKLSPLAVGKCLILTGFIHEMSIDAFLEQLKTLCDDRAVFLCVTNYTNYAAPKQYFRFIGWQFFNITRDYLIANKLASKDEMIQFAYNEGIQIILPTSCFQVTE